VIGTTQAPMPIPVTRAPLRAQYGGCGMITALVQSRPPAKGGTAPTMDQRTPTDPVTVSEQ